MSCSDHADRHSGLNISSELVHLLGFSNYFTHNTYLQYCSQGLWENWKVQSSSSHNPLHLA